MESLTPFGAISSTSMAAGPNFKRALEFLKPQCVLESLKRILNFLQSPVRELCFVNISPYQLQFYYNLFENDTNLKDAGFTDECKVIAKDILDTLVDNAINFQFDAIFEPGWLEKSTLILKKHFLYTNLNDEDSSHCEAEPTKEFKEKWMKQTLKFVKSTKLILKFPKMAKRELEHLYCIFWKQSNDEGIDCQYNKLCTSVFEAMNIFSLRYEFVLSLHIELDGTEFLVFEKILKRSPAQSKFGKNAKRKVPQVKHLSKAVPVEQLIPDEEATQTNKRELVDLVSPDFIRMSLQRILDFIRDDARASIEIINLNDNESVLLLRIRKIIPNLLRNRLVFDGTCNAILRQIVATYAVKKNIFKLKATRDRAKKTRMQGKLQIPEQDPYYPENLSCVTFLKVPRFSSSTPGTSRSARKLMNPLLRPSGGGSAMSSSSSDTSSLEDISKNQKEDSPSSLINSKADLRAKVSEAIRSPLPSTWRLQPEVKAEPPVPVGTPSSNAIKQKAIDNHNAVPKGKLPPPPHSSPPLVHPSSTLDKPKSQSTEPVKIPQRQSEPPTRGPSPKFGDMKNKLIEGLSVPIESDKAMRMMRLMGWKGGALGVRGDGLIEPIMPSFDLKSRVGLGHPAQKLIAGVASLSQFRSISANNINKIASDPNNDKNKFTNLNGSKSCTTSNVTEKVTLLKENEIIDVAESGKKEGSNIVNSGKKEITDIKDLGKKETNDIEKSGKKETSNIVTHSKPTVTNDNMKDSVEPKVKTDLKDTTEPKVATGVKYSTEPKLAKDVKDTTESKVITDVRETTKPRVITDLKDTTKPKVIENLKDLSKLKMITDVKDTTKPKVLNDLKDTTKPKEIKDMDDSTKPTVTKDMNDSTKPKVITDVKDVTELKVITDNVASVEDSAKEVTPANESNVKAESKSTKDPENQTVCKMPRQIDTVMYEKLKQVIEDINSKNCVTEFRHAADRVEFLILVLDLVQSELKFVAELRFRQEKTKPFIEAAIAAINSREKPDVPTYREMSLVNNIICIMKRIPTTWLNVHIENRTVKVTKMDSMQPPIHRLGNIPLLSPTRLLFTAYKKSDLFFILDPSQQIVLIYEVLLSFIQSNESIREVQFKAPMNTQLRWNIEDLVTCINLQQSPIGIERSSMERMLWNVVVPATWNIYLIVNFEQCGKAYNVLSFSKVRVSYRPCICRDLDVFNSSLAHRCSHKQGPYTKVILHLSDKKAKTVDKDAILQKNNIYFVKASSSEQKIEDEDKDSMIVTSVAKEESCGNVEEVFTDGEKVFNSTKELNILKESRVEEISTDITNTSEVNQDIEEKIISKETELVATEEDVFHKIYSSWARDILKSTLEITEINLNKKDEGCSSTEVMTEGQIDNTEELNTLKESRVVEISTDTTNTSEVNQDIEEKIISKETEVVATEEDVFHKIYSSWATDILKGTLEIIEITPNKKDEGCSNTEVMTKGQVDNTEEINVEYETVVEDKDSMIITSVANEELCGNVEEVFTDKEKVFDITEELNSLKESRVEEISTDITNTSEVNQDIEEKIISKETELVATEGDVFHKIYSSWARDILKSTLEITEITPNKKDEGCSSTEVMTEGQVDITEEINIEHETIVEDKENVRGKETLDNKEERESEKEDECYGFNNKYEVYDKNENMTDVHGGLGAQNIFVNEDVCNNNIQDKDIRFDIIDILNNKSERFHTNEDILDVNYENNNNVIDRISNKNEMVDINTDKLKEKVNISTGITKREEIFGKISEQLKQNLEMYSTNKESVLGKDIKENNLDLATVSEHDEIEIDISSDWPRNISIVPSDYPENNIDIFSAKVLQTELYDSVAVKDMPLLKCHGIKNGGLIYECQNERSYIWLKDKLSKNYKVLNFDSGFNKAHVIAMKLNSYIQVDSKVILQNIGSLYDDIDTNSWKVIEETFSGEHSTVTLEVDDASFTSIQKEGFSLFVGFDKAEISVLHTSEK